MSRAASNLTAVGDSTVSDARNYIQTKRLQRVLSVIPLILLVFMVGYVSYVGYRINGRANDLAIVSKLQQAANDRLSISIQSLTALTNSEAAGIQANLNLLKDCTTPGGTCKAQGDAAAAAAIDQVVARIEALLKAPTAAAAQASQTVTDQSAQINQLTTQIQVLEQEVSRLRSANPLVSPPPSIVCQLIPLSILGC